MNKGFKKYGIGLLLAAALPIMPAAAEEAAATDTLEEVVVTAQKRTESVQDVPVSITVVSSEQLARQGVSTLADLSRSSASVEFGAPGTSSPGGGAFVRGIGTNSFGFTAQASVGIVLDGVVMGNTNINSLFDLARVEILKGPQGTLFGNSVSAGVINLTTKAPDPSKKSLEISTEWGADALGSDYSRTVLRMTANLPLTTSSAVRISAHADETDGVFHNPWKNQDSTNPDSGVRVRYLAQPTDDFTINLIADYDKQTSKDVPTLTYRIAPAGSALANALSDCGVTAGTANFTYCSENNDVSDELTRGASAQLDWNLGSTTLTSITSARGRFTGSRGDIESIPLSITQNRFEQGVNCHFFDCLGIYAILPGGVNGLQTHKKTQTSEELRLASSQNKHLEWVAGVFYQDYKDEIAEGGAINGFFTGGNTVPNGNFATVKTTDYAAFGNATYYFGEHVRAIGGVRYTHSKVDEEKTDLSNPPPDRQFAVDASKVSYRAGLQMDLAARTMAYFTLATGYKGPQISDSFDNGGTFFKVNPEVPTSYELGIKTSAFDDRLALDADVFYTKVSDYQGQRCFPNTQGTITCVPTNVSGVVTKGVEFDIFGRPVRGLTLNLSGIYNPAKYPPGYLSADGSDLGGTQLTRSSRTKVTFSGEYSLPMGDTYNFVIGADATYRSKQAIYPSAAAQFVVPSGYIYNARLGVKSHDDWGVYLFGRNLGNEHFPRDLFPTPFQTGGLWQAFDASDRKIIGLQLEAKF